MNTIEGLSHLIESTIAMPELQFGIVGTDGIAVVGTNGYRMKVGTRRPHGCYLTRPQYINDVEIIRDPTHMRGCTDCEAVAVCPYSVVLCTPMTRGSQTVGVAGLLGMGNGTNDTVLKDKARWAQYLAGIAATLGRYSQVTGILEARDMTDKMLENTFRLSGKQGLILAGNDRRVLRLNQAAKAMLGQGGEQVDYNRPLDTLLPGRVLDQLYDAEREEKNIVLRQNDKLLSLSRADTGPLNLAGAIAIVVGEEHQIAPSRPKTGYPPAIPALDCIIGEDASIQNVKGIIARVAGHPLPILIQGDSGTGKELVAQAIHNLSGRAARKMIAVNCAAIPDTLLESELFGYERGAFTGASSSGKRGFFELASGSTLFLDEIGDMSLTNQAKLLRVLEQKQFFRLGGQQPIQVDVRIIAATNAPLAELVRKKKFREDLFYRLNVVPIHLKPLRERRGDIPILADYFLSRCSSVPPGSPWLMEEEVRQVLESYPWPGNIRQLQSVIGYMAAMAKDYVIDLDCLPEAFLQPDSPSYNRDGVRRPTEKELLEALGAFGRTTEGKKKAAEHLGVSLATLYRMINRFEAKT
ncbi:Anaerobic nitric oxide reductase transcription regulator NorR [bioreactor metagenome]|uniref:Anaerobic nitric oxide reductase transcription regulator NorR n=1 Tax=bioreactor metagenome TaxID=1076179 RepID=A0A644Y720_9ZZZZ